MMYSLSSFYNKITKYSKDIIRYSRVLDILQATFAVFDYTTVDSTLQLGAGV